MDRWFMDCSLGEDFRQVLAGTPVENDGFLSHTSMVKLFIILFLVEYLSFNIPNMYVSV